METKNKKQELPAWFNGQVYTHGETVKNPFSGENCYLNNLELSIYDFIMGSQMVFEMAPNSVTQKQINDFQKGLMWFRKNNVEAYFILLD
jgi:hypothetical protein